MEFLLISQHYNISFVRIEGSFETYWLSGGKFRGGGQADGVITILKRYTFNFIRFLKQLGKIAIFRNLYVRFQLTEMLFSFLINDSTFWTRLQPTGTTPSCLFIINTPLMSTQQTSITCTRNERTAKER